MPTTCAAQNEDCGPIGDGCGGLLECGNCSGGQKCGVGGKPGVCATPAPPPDAANPCHPETCSELGIGCGPAGDGCGGSLSCGSCTGGETCGGGGPSQCGGSGPCVATTCAALGASCGTQADGCGGMLSCGSCNGGATCGGGGVPNKCGAPAMCTPTTCMALGVHCGPAGDGCGGTLDCPACPADETCGGGGVASTCGAPSCVKTTCAALGVQCGPAGDGCGGTLECGPCPSDSSCGGGGTPSVCGAPGCTPKTCAAFMCGPIGDGCGGTIPCGTCTPPATCGGGGVPSQCGGDADCIPLTCAEQGFNCGLATDGCGDVINCGGGGSGADGGFDASGDAGPECPGAEVCGGGGVPNVCGPVVPCTGLCLAQVPCDGGATTTLTGTVFAPNGTDPIYAATVYVPNGTVAAFTPGVVCGCDALSGDPLVSAVTGVNGQFTLTNVPAGVSFPLVIQLGRWRRQVTIPAIAACTTVDTSSFGACTAASAASATSTTGCLTSFPTVRAQGDIPLMALVTGSNDALECVFRKIGLQDSEFGNPGGPNRMQLYLGDGPTIIETGADTGQGAGPGAMYNASTPLEDELWSTEDAIAAYDMVLFACQGEQVPRGDTACDGQPGCVEAAPSAIQQNVIDFANAGGRIFATHYNYTWLYDAPPFNSTANWAIDPYSENTFECELGGNDSCGETGIINMGFPRGLALAQWLELLYSGGTLGQIAVNTLRDDFAGGVIAPSLLWMNVNDANLGNVPLEMTFDTPVNLPGVPPVPLCGRVEFEDYHVEDTEYAITTGETFPDECDDDPMTPQEKLLEFQLFDLAACVGVPPSCAPATCASLDANCGNPPDGCGNIIQPSCGACTGGATCGGGGTPFVCGGTTCIPSTCASLGLQCGAAGDGCGSALSCPPCEAGTACVAGQCVVPPCTPLTCSVAGPDGAPAECGTPADGCGGTLTCGPCAAGTVCSDTDTCITPMCTPTTCAALDFHCGSPTNGCGGTLDCGSCNPPDTCGGGGTAGVCGSGGCQKATCGSLGFNCGPAGDGCGGELSCGTCTPPETCGGGGKASVCGGTACAPTTCAALGFNCGPAGDGCGGALACGPCPVGEACGAGGKPGVCAPLDAAACVPETCAQRHTTCGPAGDGCGGLLACGTCAPPETCGGGGTPGQCGGPACKPETCTSLGQGCGPAGDGCGGELQCGTCTPPETCGGGGTPGQCGGAVVGPH